MFVIELVVQYRSRKSSISAIETFYCRYATKEKSLLTQALTDEHRTEDPFINMMHRFITASTVRHRIMERITNSLTIFWHSVGLFHQDGPEAHN